MKFSNVAGVAIVTATIAFSFALTMQAVGGFWNAAGVWLYAVISTALVMFGLSLIDKD